MAVDRGYRGHGVDKTQVLISGTKRGLTPPWPPIEPEIRHMKTDGRLARSPLTDTISNAIFAVLCDSWHNIRKILVWLRAVLLRLIALFIAMMRCDEGRNQIDEPA